MPIVTIIAEDTENTERRVVYWTPSGKRPKTICGCDAPVRDELVKIIRVSKIYWIDRGDFPINDEKFKNYGQGLWKVKASSQLRLFGVKSGPDFVIVLCDRKKQDKDDPVIVEKARKLARLYADEQASLVTIKKDK
jgi:hypothetical protein